MAKNNNICFPLFDIETVVASFQFSEFLSLNKHIYVPTKRDRNFSLAVHELNSIMEQSYWLFLSEDRTPDGLSSSEIGNLLLLAFWIHRPTKIQLRYKFETNGFTRLLDRIQYNEVDNNNNFFTFDDFKTIKEFYNQVYVAAIRRARLNTALLNTLHGSFASNWRPAVLLYTAALEALLSFSTDPGITKRLGCCYACLVSKNKNQRDAFYEEFVFAYNLRSDVMHGRVIETNGNENLQNLSRLTDLLRTLWFTILKDQKVCIALEADDKGRKSLFDTLIKGYSCPDKNRLTIR